MDNSQLITKSVRLNYEENEKLKQISESEGLSEASVVRRFLLRGIAEYRLDQAIIAYERGEVDLSAAANHAEVSVYHMLTELEKRKISISAETEKFIDGLKSLVETFGGSEALRQAITKT